jgi:spermidine synthase
VETLDRVGTERGELVLRRDGDRYEIISNGVFLMDTSDGRSERVLVEAALERCPADAPRLLIGGLGVGFSLVRAAATARPAAIDVVEIEPAIVRWHQEHFGAITSGALADPRVRVILADVREHLAAGPAGGYDAICLDTDNGPNWLVRDANAGIYDDRGLAGAAAALAPGGVLAVWSASRDPAFEERLAARFRGVEIREIPRERGVPDVVYLGSVPGAS